jgi:hypothetical protein
MLCFSDGDDQLTGGEISRACASKLTLVFAQSYLQKHLSQPRDFALFSPRSLPSGSMRLRRLNIDNISQYIHWYAFSIMNTTTRDSLTTENSVAPFLFLYSASSTSLPTLGGPALHIFVLNYRLLPTFATRSYPDLIPDQGYLSPL